MLIGVITALDAEYSAIHGQLSDARAENNAGCEFAFGNFGDSEVILCKAGMGTVNAAAATQLLITIYGAQTVLFTGIAGNLSPKLKIGDIVIGKTLRYTDTETDLIAESAPFLNEYASDSALIRIAERAAIDHNISYYTGIIATGNRFVDTAQERELVSAQTKADCVEMEGAAVAHICAKNDIPCLIIRAMSDNCDEDYEEFSDDFINIAEHAERAATLVLEVIASIA